MEVTTCEFDNFLGAEIFICQEFKLSVIVNFGCFRVDTEPAEKE